MKKYEILRVVVGSQAHGTANEYSDKDFRGVYIEPSSQLLSMGYKSKGVSWVEGESEDQTAYELENFLNLAIQGHPNILEMFVSPINKINKDGKELLKLFPYIYSPNKAYTAFKNYADNRRKNMFNAENESVRVKSAYCHIRVLYNLVELLKNGTFSIEVKDEKIMNILLSIKEGEMSSGKIINLGEELELIAKAYLHLVKENNQDIEKVKKYLMKMRKKYWN